MKDTNMMDQIISQASALPCVSLKATTAYHVNTPALVSHVNNLLTSTPEIYSLIGHNPLQMMYDNHKHHAAFMTTVFSISNYELLARTLPWVYRAYHSHGFEFDYFLIEIKGWMEANNHYLDKTDADTINVIYEWLISRHTDIISIAMSDSEYRLPISEKWLDLKNSFQSALLDGDHKRAMKLAQESIRVASDIQDFYLQIIQPSMYEIGMMWEKARISVAQEHLASAIVGRVMAGISMERAGEMQSRGRAVVTASLNEFHELGAWMISDSLEQDGWDVRYLGANMPREDLVTFIKSFTPDLLALSVTMPFNINHAREVITQIRGDNELKDMKIITGGRVFNETPELWRSTGADGFGRNLEEAVALAARLCFHG